MQHPIRIAPSVMCCDFLHMGDQIRIMEEEKIDLLHIDVMDGSFVPNFALGSDLVRQLKEKSRIPVDIHLMVKEPERHLNVFPFGEGDWVSIHAESTPHLQKTLQAIRERGAKAMLALNPSTPLCVAEEVLDDVDALLLMAVNPGFAGQKMIPGAPEKIRRAREFLNAHAKENVEIEVDGNVSLQNAPIMVAAGANILVAGSSGIFFGNDLAANIRTFRRAVGIQ